MRCGSVVKFLSPRAMVLLFISGGAQPRILTCHMMFYSVKNILLIAVVGAGVGRYFYMKNTIDLMARTMWGEGRNQGKAGMLAIGNVIKNRADRGGWFGRSVVDVITKDMQFSAWNIGDPNRAKMMAVTDKDPQFAEALRLANQIMTGKVADNTGGADHYHTAAILPYWASDMPKTAIVGDHIFYRSA
ncbi:cell wall hydrolase [Paremcibacter congregatus]|nr:cell wall hydrolase [Paremcibacter congregatus]QDE27281.1 cell wall hydrolase [Paremcibacter congregatus]